MHKIFSPNTMKFKYSDSPRNTLFSKHLLLLYSVPFILRFSSCAFAFSLAIHPKLAINIIIEMIVLSLALISTTKLFRIVLLPFILLHIAQFTNLIVTGNFVVPETIENIDTAPVIGSVIYYAIAVSLFYSSLWVPHFFQKSIFDSTKYNYAILSVAIAIVCLVKQAPIHRLGLAVWDAWDSMTFVQKYDPLIKKSFARNFLQSYKINQYGIKCKDCNVIIIFAEGTSSLVISPVLTPNTFNFSNEETINFTRYFNHQAATFRGIRGSLISGFTYRGGAFGKGGVGFFNLDHNKIIEQYSNSVESLPTILSNKGYNTTFISPHNNKDALAPLMRATGFEITKIAEVDKSFESDKNTYERLFDEARYLHNKGKPFLLSAYIVGTHHGLDSPDLKFVDGNNSYLNKFYNQDHWFGEFLKRFKQSKISDNTILVFTADHSTYPSTEYKKTFKSSCSVFHDQIPLIIYKKGMKNIHIDAGLRTSLALAPTVLDILGIVDVRNHFLANSLFDQPTKWERFCAQGKSMYHVDDDGIVREIKSVEFKELLTKFYSFSG